jgi:methionyl-tRNA formyltransferase
MTVLNLVFMGTPEFAAVSLGRLTQTRHRISAVVCQPDKPQGRGRVVAMPAVKRLALAQGLRVIQPPSPRQTDFIDQIQTLGADLLIVVAYGHILSPTLLAMPRLGGVNLHASLLPRYRGPAPIQWAIINGDAITGVTTLWMDKGMDTGDLLFSRPVAIDPRDTSASLHDRLADAGADLLAATIQALAAGPVARQPQDHGKATYAPPLKKSDGRMDWSKPAPMLDAFVRGMTPWPGAFTHWGQKQLKVLSASCLVNRGGAPGTVLDVSDGVLVVAAGQGALAIHEIQEASAKRLSAAAYLRGSTLEPGMVLG